MAKKPVKFRPVGTVWEPVPEKEESSGGGVWGWLALLVIGAGLLSQCS